MAMVSHPDNWRSYKTAEGREFYADNEMAKGSDSNILLTSINFYKGHLAPQRLGLRSIDDIEYNTIVNANEGIANQMKKYAVWTSFLRKVERANGGYTAKHIARPEVSIKDDICIVGGAEKSIKLPKDGWFKISHLLQSEDGLPHETFEQMPDEPSAYFWIAEGPERPVFRGRWLLDRHGQFHTRAHLEPFDSDPLVGIRVASDEEPKPINFATAEALFRLDEIGRRYGVEPSDIACALANKQIMKAKPSHIVF